MIGDYVFDETRHFAPSCKNVAELAGSVLRVPKLVSFFNVYAALKYVFMELTDLQNFAFNGIRSATCRFSS